VYVKIDLKFEIVDDSKFEIFDHIYYFNMIYIYYFDIIFELIVIFAHESIMLN